MAPVDRGVRLLGFGVLVAAGRTQLCSIKPPRFSWRLPVMVLAATGLVSVLVTVIEPLEVTNRRALTVVESFAVVQVLLARLLAPSAPSRPSQLL